MKIKTIYIDDDDRELIKYERKFTRDDRANGRFEIVTINAQRKIEDLIKEVEKKKPELILVDFDLAKPKDDVLIGISGTALSTALREKFQEVPIVLFTRKHVFKIDKYPPRVLTSLDEIVYKNDVFVDEPEHLNFLYDLAIGFKKLRGSRARSWDSLLKILNAPTNDNDNLSRSNPPDLSGDTWSVSEVSNWIRNILIKYPGLLYDPVHSATFLGISEEAFLSEPIQKKFARAKYSGIFAPPEGRWWKSKLLDLAVPKMNQKEGDLPIREGFPSVWERTNKTTIERSKCIFSGEFPAELVCYVLKKPVKIKYSLAYRVDIRPEVMDEERVSFKAIRTTDDFNEDLFDPLGKEMLPEIKRMSRDEGR